MTLILLLTACPHSVGTDTSTPTDTDETGGETGDTATPESLDGTLPDFTGVVGGCRWVYAAGNKGDAYFVADLALPEADELTRTDLSYSRALGAEDTLVFAGGAGAGEVSIYDCSDMIETYDGVHTWTATEAQLSIDAEYITDHPEWTCDGVSDNPLYSMSLTITDARFVDEAGAEATLSTFGPLTFSVADYCGG